MTLGKRRILKKDGVCVRTGFNRLYDSVQWDVVTSRELTWWLRMDQPSEEQELHCMQKYKMQAGSGSFEVAALQRALLQSVDNSRSSI